MVTSAEAPWPEEIQTGGVDAELWPFFEKGLIERAEKSIQFH